MRNRVYITSIQNIRDITETNSTNTRPIDIVNAWTYKHKNVLTFVPNLNGLFINGKYYHSLDDVMNDRSVKSVFYLTVIQEANTNNIYDTNYIKLIQSRLKKEYDIDSIIFSIPVNINETSKIVNIAMNIGDRIQMFMDYNGNIKFETTNKNIAVVDRNYIIHALSIPAPGESGIIYIKYDDRILYTIKINIFGSGNDIYQANVNDEILAEICNNNEDDAPPSYDNVVDAYENASRNRGGKATDKISNIVVNNVINGRDTSNRETYRETNTEVSGPEIGN